MDRAPIVPYEERVKRRREYLRKIAAANTLETIGSGVTMVFGSLALFITSVFWLNLLMFEPTVEPGRLVFFLQFLLVTGLPALLGGLLWHASARKSRSIPFVPPIGEQIAALPVDEVLLRGSDQPDTAPGELLRTAHDGTGTASGELLRTVENRIV